MQALGMTRNTVTYTTLLSGIAKSKWKQLDPALVMEIHRDMVAEGVPRNGAVFGAVISAAERLDDFETALRLLEEMKAEGIPTSSFIYHSVISACGKGGKYETALSLLDEMKVRGVARTEVTYSLMIGSCKREGRWQEALRLLAEMESDDNSSSKAAEQPAVGDEAAAGDHTGRLQPDTIAYSSAIAVCVNSNQWEVALTLLEKMESAGISRNVVTYNTVIEALSSAGETVRAELVYQGGLRAGIYNHWHWRSPYYALQSANGSAGLVAAPDRRPPQIRVGAPSRGIAPGGAAVESPAVMDLHNFPVAVARAALMHVLGDMCMGSVPVGDPLVIITGRGNHPSVEGQRGVLKKELQGLCLEMGLKLLSDEDLHDYDVRGSRPAGAIAGDAWRWKKPGDAPVKRFNPNPGRLWLTKAVTEEWFAEQMRDDEQRRALGSAGGAHGNLFLQVARAKHKRLSSTSSALGGLGGSPSSSGDIDTEKTAMNIRAVCPFSTATLPAEQASAVAHPHAASSGSVAAVDTPVAAEQAVAKKGVCPAHAQPTTVTAEAAQDTAVTPASEQKLAAKGVCPAHAQPATVTAEAAQDTAVTPASEQKLATKGVCPAHAHAQPTVVAAQTAAVDAATEAPAAEKKGGCPAHGALEPAAAEQAVAKKGVCPAHAQPTTVTAETVQDTAVTPASEQKLATKGVCPAHAALEPAAVIEQKVEKKGVCPAHAHVTPSSADS
jgi:pentatricopeptide repeat protein